MWICGKCGREFKRENQSHYCGNKPQSIDEYIMSFDADIQARLRQVRASIHAAIPDAKEMISWSMPTYWHGRNIIHFAGQKYHIGLYTGEAAVEHFSDLLTQNGLHYNKGTIHIPYSHELPLKLIGKIAKWCFDASSRD